MTKVSATILDAVEAALPLSGAGARPKDVHAACDRWASQTIRSALRALVADGRARFEGDDCRRRYWRAPAAEGAPSAPVDRAVSTTARSAAPFRDFVATEDEPAYWLLIQSADNWFADLAQGFTLYGMSENHRALAERIRAGDILIHYVTPARFADIRCATADGLRPLGRSSHYEDRYPWAIATKPLITLPWGTWLPAKPLALQLGMVKHDDWRHWFRRALTLLDAADGRLLVEALRSHRAIYDADPLSAATEQPKGWQWRDPIWQASASRDDRDDIRAAYADGTLPPRLYWTLIREAGATVPFLPPHVPAALAPTGSEATTSAAPAVPHAPTPAVAPSPTPVPADHAVTAAPSELAPDERPPSPREHVDPVAAAPPILLGLDDQGRPSHVDLPELIAGRMLVKGNSGAGKSWLLRRLLEQTWGLVQQIIVDPEGEFTSLASHHGHLAITPRPTDDLDRLAGVGTRLREHRVSALLDLSELPDRDDQVHVVAAFLRGLFLAGPDHWHPCLVAIDEAHLFAPHGPTGDVTEDTRKAGLAAMADLMARGRKRGLCGVLATQRLARMAKAVAAEPANFLVGRTLIDVDVARAAELLGWDRKSGEALRDLRPGQFVAFGPAVAVRAMVVAVGPTTTRHLGATPVLTPPPLRTAEEAASLVRVDLTPPPPPVPAPARNGVPAPPDGSSISFDVVRETETAEDRYAILRPIIEAGTASRELVERQADQAGRSASTIRAWLARYKREGLAGLAARPRGRAAARVNNVQSPSTVTTH